MTSPLTNFCFVSSSESIGSKKTDTSDKSNEDLGSRVTGDKDPSN